jgi:predicted ATPase
MHFLKSLQLDGFLSFAPGSEAITLGPLNVLIGPNGSGKSNLLEALALLNATPVAFAAAIRDGGGAREWLWKGDDAQPGAGIEATLSGAPPSRDLRYRLAFAASAQRTEIIDEVIEEEQKQSAAASDVRFHYRFQGGNPVINLRSHADANQTGGQSLPDQWRAVERHSLLPDESILSQRKDPDLYPELTWVGQQFARIQLFREWGFGRATAVRKPQPADLPSNLLLPDASNLGLVLNQMEHAGGGPEFNRLLSQFLPRYQRVSTLVQGGTVQFYLHEHGLKAPIPAARLSDGTIRFMAMLALLLSPEPPPLICMEEPELGLHPDALALLANLLVEASSRTQLIVTTHSDAMVSALTAHADAILVCEHRGGTMLRRVDPGKLRFWLDRYRLGEI